MTALLNEKPARVKPQALALKRFGTTKETASTVPTAKRREREKLQRRDDIIRVATDLFADKGFSATTIDEIAKSAELSRGTIYLYFKNKEDLYEAVCIETIKLAMVMEEEARDKEGLEDKIRTAYMAFVDHCLANRSYHLVAEDYLFESIRRNVPAALTRRVNKVMAEMLRYPRGLVTEAIETVLFRPDIDPDAFNLTAWRMAAGIGYLAFIGDERIVKQGSLKKIFEESVNVMIEGAKAK